MTANTMKLHMNPTGEYGQVQFGDDSKTFVIFFKKSMLNKKRSAEENRPIYESVDCIKIQQPGETLNKIERPVREEDKFRWPNQWSRYLHNQTQVPEGTPVELLFPNHPHVADNLKALNIFTVEQLSNLSAHAMDIIGMGAQEYVNKAKSYLQSSKKGVDFHRMQAELDKRDTEIKTLNRKLDMQKKQIDDLMLKIANPDNFSYNPSFNPEHDVQSERINANHVTKDMTNHKPKPIKKKPVAPPKEEVEQVEMINSSVEDDPFNLDVNI